MNEQEELELELELEWEEVSAVVENLEIFLREEQYNYHSRDDYDKRYYEEALNAYDCAKASLRKIQNIRQEMYSARYTTVE